MPKDQSNAVQDYYRTQLEGIGYGQPGGAPAGARIEIPLQEQLVDESEPDAETSDEGDIVTGEPSATTEELVALAVDDPEGFAEQVGLDADAWLEWALEASPAEFAQAATAAGLPGLRQPLIADINDDAVRVYHEQRRLDARVEQSRQRNGWSDR